MLTKSVTSTWGIYIGSRLFNTPFWTLYNLLTLILYKELGATPLQLAIAVALKPAASLLSPYWSSLIHSRPNLLRRNLIGANLLKYIPFLFFPWIQSVWYALFAFGFYMVFVRGATPAWMELLKQKFEGTERSRLAALGSFIDHMGSALLPLLIGWLLDSDVLIWRWLFFYAALFGLISTSILWFLPSASGEVSSSVRLSLAKPFKECWQLLKNRPDFVRFQIGFMLGGSALMLMHPLLPTFFIDILQLSYTKIALAIALAKAVGFAISSPWWLKRYEKQLLLHTASAVMLAAAGFFVILLLSPLSLALLYLAFVSYGIMQAGSELVWHMSGIVFAKEKDSAPFSTTNLLAVGVRGAVMPLIGSLLISLISIPWIMGLSLILELLAALQLHRACKQESAPST